MRRLVLLAAVPLLLSGCYWGGTPSGGSDYGYDPETSVRAAIPALEAYNADHGTYRGVTLGALRQYDTGVTGVRIVRATATTYCVESTDSPPFHKAGPAAPIVRGTC
jgi:hypothetical protein